MNRGSLWWNVDLATPLELETQEMDMETSDGPQKIFWGSGVPGVTQRGRSSTSSRGYLGPIATPLELETQETNMETSDGPQKIFGVSGVPGFTQRPIDFSSFSWLENQLISASILG